MSFASSPAEGGWSTMGTLRYATPCASSHFLALRHVLHAAYSKNVTGSWALMSTSLDSRATYHDAVRIEGSVSGPNRESARSARRLDEARAFRPERASRKGSLGSSRSFGRAFGA